MKFITVDQWNEEVWEKWRIVYQEAFGHTNGKQEKIFQNMFRKNMCTFHYLMNGEEIVAIALTGKLLGTRLLLIDYLAVSKRVRGKGFGKRLVEKIHAWGQSQGYTGILIEVEAEHTTENVSRIHFWKKCGYTETSYVHNYKVVPEPYKAMYVKFGENTILPDREEDFFSLLSNFHQKSFKSVHELTK